MNHDSEYVWINLKVISPSFETRKSLLSIQIEWNRDDFSLLKNKSGNQSRSK